MAPPFYILVSAFITQYLRPTLTNATTWPDATLEYWIDQALLDISRSFPKKDIARFAAITGTQYYEFGASTTSADETNIIRILNCIYPAVDDVGPKLALYSHIEEDFEGGQYYDVDHELKYLYLGPTALTGDEIYCDVHCIWKTTLVITDAITNPAEHYELIRLYCIWQAYLALLSTQSTAAVPDEQNSSTLSYQVMRAERAYRQAYKLLDESKATSTHTDGWAMDKWDVNYG